ncbi:MarR family winged helix-turn-helix transcriptional regulator [Sporolactobacillus sp. CQH2019]|nr:MarR family winged helix-turn-helix transcriptional regulator [Sporolactobacillus sp. CQH2019]
MIMKKDRKTSNANDYEEHLSVADKYPVSFAIFALSRSHRALAARMIRKAGLFPGQEIMLMQLWDRDGQSQNCLGRTLCLDHSTVAKSVCRLEAAGLVVRHRSEKDGRVTLVSLTRAGRDLKEKVLGFWSDLESITTEGLTEREKTVLVDLSRKIGSRIERSLGCNHDDNKQRSESDAGIIDAGRSGT